MQEDCRLLQEQDTANAVQSETILLDRLIKFNELSINLGKVGRLVTNLPLKCATTKANRPRQEVEDEDDDDENLRKVGWSLQSRPNADGSGETILQS